MINNWSLKKTDIEWLPVIPNNWVIKRCKYLFKLITEQAPENNYEELLSVYTDIGVKPRKDLEQRGNRATTTDNYWLVKKNDIIINKLLAWMGAIGVSEYEGVTSPAYDILRPNDGVNPHFYSYLLRNTIIHTELKKYSRGIMEMRLRLYFDELGKVKLPFPPLDVQNKIVRFLNEKLFDIDRYVSSKQKQIDLLNEQKSAFINQVVTKGLDSNVKMKDSGIEWIGEIPSNWIVKPLKYYVHMNIETLPESTDPDYEFEYLDIGNVQTGKIVGDIEKHKFQNAPSRARRIVENGNTIISTVRTYLKAVLYIKNEFSKYIVSTGFAVLKPKKEVIPYFLYLAVQNHPFINMVTAKSVGASYPAINPTTLGSLKLVVPKDVDEQNKIVEFISAQIKKIDQNINSIENQIKLISEYKHSLIAEAVTGKLKIT